MSANAKSAGPYFLVGSETGDWHYLPVEASTPAEAVAQSEPEWMTNEGTEYYVYELTGPIPTKITLKRVLQEIG